MKAWKRFFWKLVISGIILYLLSIKFADISMGIPMGQHPLEAGWARTGLIVNEVSLEGWDLISHRFETVKELQTRMEHVIKDLGLTSAEAPVVGGGEGFHYVNVTGRTSNGGQAVVVLQSIALNAGGETHLGFTLNHEGQQNGVEKTIEDFNGILRKHGMKKPLAVAIQGQTPGRLDEIETEALFERCFRTLKADRINGGWIEDYRNWRGKSGMLPRKGAGPQGVNLEISAVYDPKRNITSVTMATPSMTEGM